jgi:hypothetical protein
VISTDILPDDVLLAIFDFYVDENQSTKPGIEAWQSLVHVCWRWRSIVFGSSHRLNLRLVCTSRTPRDVLDVWPALPLLIWDNVSLEKGMKNIVASLEHSNRMEKIELFNVDGVRLERVLKAMQKPFPELTVLALQTFDRMELDLPDSFLGGSPRLRHLDFRGIPFPGLPKLLLSAPPLVDLCLLDIPHSGYISPEAMVTALSALTSLESLRLRFQYHRYRPDQASRRLPPPTRSVLPVITHFRFDGACKYLEDLVACIDTPQLKYLDIGLLNQNHFRAPQLILFISRTSTFEPLQKAHIAFDDYAVGIKLKSSRGELNVKVQCEDLHLQLASLEKICASCLPPLSTLETLYVYADLSLLTDWEAKDEETSSRSLLVWHWLELLEPFTAVENLYLCEAVTIIIAPALLSLGGGTEVFPTLQVIFLEVNGRGQVAVGDIQNFAAARRRSGHDIDVFLWDRPALRSMHLEFDD